MIFLAILVILPFSSSQVSAAPPAGVLKQAIHWSFSSDWLDPATGGFPIPAVHPMYLFHDALLKPMAEGLYTPSLAESWTTSPDAKVYEFKLRKGVKFHNGDSFTAEDVVFSFLRYKGSLAKVILGRTGESGGGEPVPGPLPLQGIFPGVSGIPPPRSHHDRLDRSQEIRGKSGRCGVSRSIPSARGRTSSWRFVPGVKLVGEAFEGYWRKVPHVKRMEFYIIPEPATRLAMAKRGEVDIATLMQGVFYEDLKKDARPQDAGPLSPVRWVAYLAAQWDPKSPWADPRVRLAASLAIDRQTLADVFMPGCGGVSSIGLEGDPMAIDFPPYPYDPEKARKLLGEAGYPKGFDGGKFYPYEGGYWPYGEQIATYWKAVGITVETVLLESRPCWPCGRGER